MLFKHCFYIFNNVSFYPSLLSFPEIRKLQVPDLLQPRQRSGQATQYVAMFSAESDAICCVPPLPRDRPLTTLKGRFAYSLAVIHFRKLR